MSLLETLILFSYVFTAGCYIWVWTIYRTLSNHYRTRLQELERRVLWLEDHQ